jgi:hypothetical protein
VIAGVLLLGLLTIPAQTQARTTPPSGSYSYYYALALPSTGHGGELAGVGANAPLVRPGDRSAQLPIAGASALVGLGLASVGASFFLRRNARPPA